MLVVFMFRFVFQSGRMAGDTISIISNAFFQMDFAHFGFRMRVAIGASVCYVVASMTGLAGNLPFIPMIQGEGVGVEFGGCPGSGAVAKFTLQTELTGMNDRFLVTVGTSAGRVLELLPGMAVLAGCFDVCPIQDKSQIMVKVARFAAPLVTFQAGCAKQVGMFGHKNGVGLCMAGLAIYSLDGVNGFLVAIVAGHFCAIEVSLVGHEAEPGQAIMVELAEGHLGDRSVAPGVVGVAGLAALGVYEMTM